MQQSSPALARILRAFRYDTAGQLAVQLATLGSGVVLARSLGPADFGRFALVLAIASTASLLANLGGTETLTRFVAEFRARGSVGTVIRVAWPLLAMRVAMSLVAGLVIVLMRSPIGELIGLGDSITLWIALMVLANTAFAGFQGPLQVLLVNVERQRFLNAVAAVGNAGVFAVLLTLAFSGLLTIETAVAANTAALLVRVVLLAFGARRALADEADAELTPKIADDHNSDVRRRMVRYAGVMFLIGAGGFLLQSRSDTYLVGAVLGVQAVAFYQIAEGFSRTAFSVPASRLSGFFTTGLLTEGYVQSGLQSVRNRFTQIVRLRFAVSVPIGFGGALLADEIVNVVYGSEFAGAAGFLVLFFLLQMPLQWIGAISGVLVAIEKPHWFLWTKLVSLGTIPLTIWALGTWGVSGAIVTTVGGTATAAGIEFVVARRHTGITFPASDVARYFIAGGIMSLPVAIIGAFMPGPAWLVLLAAVPVGAVTYAYALFAVRAFSRSEIAAIRGAFGSGLKGVPESGH